MHPSNQIYFKSNMYLDTNLPAKEQHQDSSSLVTKKKGTKTEKV
jgi:hypothetical protein